MKTFIVMSLTLLFLFGNLHAIDCLVTLVLILCIYDDGGISYLWISVVCGSLSLLTLTNVGG